MKLTTLESALILHAIAAPIIFTALSLVYFHRFGLWSPFRTAAAFLGIVVVMDVFVVALLIERSFEMFESVLGTWLPFLLIFSSTWCTGVAVSRTAHRTAA
jgi:hypothetical protein